MMPADAQQKLVVVGCGAAKADDPQPARDLYTSTYFQKKREYAETVGDQWRVLSAEHGLVRPDKRLEPYETSIGDLSEQELEGWADLVVTQLEEWTSFELAEGAGEIVLELLAGKGYVDPIRSPLVIAGERDFALDVRFPFDETSGIGEQMGWLSDRVEESRSTGTVVADD